MEQTLGKRIMQCRKRLGLTQDQLAEKLGVTAQAVSKWENNQSCPDISILPKLASILGISTDALLGNETDTTVHVAEVVGENEQEQDGLHFQNDNWEFRYNSGKKGAVCFALMILAVGIQLLLGKLLHIELSFWSTLWPTALFFFGIMGVVSKFSFLHIGCILFGGYFLLNNYQLLPFSLGSELVFPVILVLFGLSLLADAFKKPGKPTIHFQHNGKRADNFQVDGETFTYTASFGDAEQFIDLPRLSHGKVSTSFGDYDVDLSGVEEVTDDCHLDISCSFGDLTLLVPRRYAVRATTATSLAEISIEGHPEDSPAGIIHVKASASFGEITIQYV